MLYEIKQRNNNKWSKILKNLKYIKLKLEK